MAPRYGIVDPHVADSTVLLGHGEAVEVHNHLGYSDSRDAAQEAAGTLGGIFVEREEPSFGQRGAYALTITRCRGCDEGACGIPSHGRD